MNEREQAEHIFRRYQQPKEEYLIGCAVCGTAIPLRGLAAVLIAQVLVEPHTQTTTEQVECPNCHAVLSVTVKPSQDK